MRRALLLVWEFPPGPGGIGQHAYSVAEALNDEEFEVTIITTCDYSSLGEVRKFDNEHNHLRIIRTRGPKFYQYLRRIIFTWYVVITQQPIRIICSGKGALWLLPSLKLISRGQLVAFIHGSEIRLPQLVSRQLIGFSLRFADRIFCVSRFTRNLLPTQILNRMSVLVLPNGVLKKELPAKRPMPLSKIELLGAPRLITVGQLTRRKGQHRVIQALHTLCKKWPNIHYHMVGLDTDRDLLLTLAKDLKVEKYITIHGRVADRQDLFRAYCASDIFMMLSENQPDGDVEGFGIAILEANYFGVPAIGALGCGIEDAIEPGVNGYLVDGNDPKAILEAVDACLSNRANMQAGMQQWVKDHDWNQLIKQFLT